MAIEYHGTLETFNGGNCQLVPTGKHRELLMNFGVQPVSSKPVLRSARNRGGGAPVVPGRRPPEPLHGPGREGDISRSSPGFSNRGIPIDGAVRYRTPRKGITAVAWQCRGAIKRTAS